MKRTALVGYGIIWFSLFLLGVPTALPAGDLKDRVRKIHRKHDIQPENAGILLMDYPTGEQLYRQNHQEPFIPASNTKIITALIALRILGPTFRFHTTLYTGGTKDGRTNLYIKGGGDPGISKRFNESRTAVFKKWARKLKQRDHHSFDRLVLDDSMYRDREIHPTWDRYKLSFWYTAPVNALIFNENCVYVRVVPTSPGQKARVNVDPEGSPVNILNRTRTVSKNKTAGIEFKRIQGTWNIRVSGTIKPKTARREWITVAEPTRYFGSVFQQVLNEHGISIRNGIQIGEIPRSVRGDPPIIRRSFPLTRTLDKMLKESQNLFAETIVKQVAHHQTGTGTWEEGSRLTRSCLKKLGIPVTNCKFVDGSGLSRANRLTPKTLVSALNWWLQNDRLNSYVRFLPTAGREGTLEHRLTSDPYRGRIVAKTGTLSDVITLSGIAGRNKKDLDDRDAVLFSVLINQEGLHKAQGKQFCDDVAKLALDLARNPKSLVK